MKHLQEMLHTNRGRFFIWTPGPVPFGTCIYFPIMRLVSQNVSRFRTLNFEHPLVRLFYIYMYLIMIGIFGLQV